LTAKRKSPRKTQADGKARTGSGGAAASTTAKSRRASASNGSKKKTPSRDGYVDDASEPEVIETSGATIVEDQADDYQSTGAQEDDSDADEDVADDSEFVEDALDDSTAYDESESIGAGDADRTASITLAGSKTSLASRDPLQAYMREVQTHSLLSPEEEKALAIRYTESQDLDAAARLVTANLRLVVKLAYEYRRAYRNMMDLIQEGNMGLMQAVKKYDPYRGVKLSSYAAWWIRAYMLRYILANWRMVKLGTTQAQRKLFINLNKEKSRLSAMGIEPTNREIAARLDVTEKEVEEMDKRLARSDASLDTPVNESDGRQIARVELLPAPGEQPDIVTEGAEISHLLREHLAEFREGLSGKDLIIFDERLVAEEPRTLQDLGNQFGVSRERVRQLESRMTGKLKEFLSERMGDPVTVG
jgi:RNA polymerase sigma-32 factor